MPSRLYSTAKNISSNSTPLCVRGSNRLPNSKRAQDVPEARDGDSSSLYESSVSHESISAVHGNNDRELVRPEAGDDGDGAISTT